MNTELQIGSFGLSVVLSILLRMIYGTWNVNTKYKPWIAVCIGMVLSGIAMYATATAYTVPMIINYVTQGFMTGATATGIYEMTRTKE